MKTKLLIASFDLEIGGVERSLISMLEHLDYNKFEVDLLLYRRDGDFLKYVPESVALLEEIPKLATFRKSIQDTLKQREYGIVLYRIVSKAHATAKGKLKRVQEPGYYQMQYMWKYALPRLPVLEKKYDIAISYLWPHYYVGGKVRANKKIAWIHTDYSAVETDVRLDYAMWDAFDRIVAVSEACKGSFLEKYAGLKNKVVVVENIASPDMITKMAADAEENPMTRDDRFKILTVARLSHAKGIDNAVKALRIVKDRGYDRVAWYVVGYGGDESMIRGLIAENRLEDSFILLGKKINPYCYIRSCDLYVQPSRYEGKAVTVTEAKILGKPILITNYPTAASQIRHEVDGIVTGLSVDGIADGIERLYNDPGLRQRLADVNRQADHRNQDEMSRLYQIFGASS